MATVASQETTTSSFDGAHQVYNSNYREKQQKKDEYHSPSSLTTNPALATMEYISGGGLSNKEYFPSTSQGTATTSSIGNSTLTHHRHHTGEGLKGINGIEEKEENRGGVRLPSTTKIISLDNDSNDSDNNISNNYNNGSRIKSKVGTVRTFGNTTSRQHQQHHHQHHLQNSYINSNNNISTISSSSMNGYPPQQTSRRAFKVFPTPYENESKASYSDLSTSQQSNVPSLQHQEDIFSFLQQKLSFIFPSLSKRRFEASNQLKFILNCCMWYVASSLTNNTGKQILNAFRYPVTLTFVQFGLVAICCFAAAKLFGATHIRKPTSDITKTIVPLAIFLIVGHVFSSVAISRIPVSLVHTIKALAPLFTVLFYRFIFQVSYSMKVYISLLPLTLGVILACSFTFSNNMVGLACALGSCFVFVTQNIFSKKILFKESKLGDRNPNKLDKMNVLFYSSSISFLLMIPLWYYYEGYVFMDNSMDNVDLATATTMNNNNNINSISHFRLFFYFILNGTMNFGQNWFAFTTLSLTSPVTYSILSLLKRIFVIVMSILWFGQQVTWTQSFGILLTFGGLWLYQRAKQDIDRGEREKSVEMLPTAIGGANNQDIKIL